MSQKAVTHMQRTLHGKRNFIELIKLRVQEGEVIMEYPGAKGSESETRKCEGSI